MTLLMLPPMPVLCVVILWSVRRIISCKVLEIFKRYCEIIMSPLKRKPTPTLAMNGRPILKNHLIQPLTISSRSENDETGVTESLRLQIYRAAHLRDVGTRRLFQTVERSEQAGLRSEHQTVRDFHPTPERDRRIAPGSRHVRQHGRPDDPLPSHEGYSNPVGAGDGPCRDRHTAHGGARPPEK